MQQYFAELCHDVKIRFRAARQYNLSTGISSVKIRVGKGAAICRDQQMRPMVVTHTVNSLFVGKPSSDTFALFFEISVF